MTEQKFTVEVKKFEGNSGGYGFIVPFNVESEFGTKAMVRVRGTIDGVPYRSSISPRGDGTHYIVINKEVRSAIGKMDGGMVEMMMDIDTEKREVEMPEDFQGLLDANESARAFFERLAYSHQKEYVEWINDAKKPETRTRRLEQTIEMLVQGKKAK